MTGKLIIEEYPYMTEADNIVEREQER